MARLSFRYRWAVLIAVAVAAPIALVAGRGVFTALDPGGYDDPSTESIKERELNVQEFGLGRADFVVLYTADSGKVTDPAAASAIQEALNRGGDDPSVTRMLSFFNTGAQSLVSQDGTRTFAVMSMEGDVKEKLDRFEHLEELFKADGPVKTEYGGVIPVFHENQVITERDLRRAELIAFPITAILLLLIFRSAVAAMVPLVLGGLAIVFALAIVLLLSMLTRVNIFALNIVTILGLGLAIDYSLFILSRYREEVSELGVEGAIIRSVGTTGRAVAFSGVTLTASLIALFFFPQVYLRSLAMGGIAVTMLAILMACTVLPALLGVLGDKIERLRLPFFPSAEEEAGSSESGFWHTLAFAVMRRPVIIGVTVVAFLLLLGAPFLRVTGSTQDARALARGIEARDVFDILNKEFTPHETTPHQLLIEFDGPALTPEHVGELFDFAERLKAVDGIQRIDSVFGIQPGLTREEYQSLASVPPGSLDPQVLEAISLFIKDNFARFSLVSKFELDSSEAQHQVEEIRAIEPPADARLLVGGDAAELFDIKHSIIERLPEMLGFIGVATFIVLFLVFGSITLPFKAMLMNLLSLTASFGATVLIFQDGRFQGLLHYESLGTIDITLPIVLFAIVFGLSMDYEVLMLSRVREEYDRTGDNTLAVARGLEKTGRLITSAAAILIVVILAFATSSLTNLKSLGIGMALAIFIDATIVRALLVPATMRMMGSWNWWAPGPLHRFWERLGLGDLEGHGTPAPRPAQTGLHPALAIANGQVTRMPAAAAPIATATTVAPVAPVAPVATQVLSIEPSGPSFIGVFRVSQGPQAGQELAIRSTATVGRAPDCDIIVTDPLASGHHFRVSHRDGATTVEDLGSTNGTILDGERLDGPRPLTSGAEIKIGATLLTFSAAKAPEVAEGAVSMVPPTVLTKRVSRLTDYLVVLEGEAPGTVHRLDGDTIGIGRDPRNTIVVNDVKVSGFHARIQRGLDGGLVIEDRNSSNGTYLNEVLIDEGYRLADQDVIRVGDTTFQFVMGS
ncbi:MAG: MMPL family transporter [Dehalococcoidia bacterium]